MPKRLKGDKKANPIVNKLLAIEAEMVCDFEIMEKFKEGCLEGGEKKVYEQTDRCTSAIENSMKLNQSNNWLWNSNISVSKAP